MPYSWQPKFFTRWKTRRLTRNLHEELSANIKILGQLKLIVFTMNKQILAVYSHNFSSAALVEQYYYHRLNTVAQAKQFLNHFGNSAITQRTIMLWRQPNLEMSSIDDAIKKCAAAYAQPVNEVMTARV